MTNKITREELRALVESGEATVVEALPAAYFEQEHIPGAIQVDYEQLELQAPGGCPTSTPRSSPTARA